MARSLMMKPDGKSIGATALASAAAKLQARQRRTNRRRRPTLFLLTDDERLADPIAAVRNLPAGVAGRRPRYRAGVVVRTRDTKALADLVRVLTPICRRRGIALMVANDFRQAQRYRAAGVHLAERQIRQGTLSALGLPRRGSPSRRRLIVSGAAHSWPALLRAERLGLDAIFLSPVFSTASHPDTRPFGCVRFAALIHRAHRSGVTAALVALGGVNEATSTGALGTGADGLAAIGALAAAPI